MQRLFSVLFLAFLAATPAYADAGTAYRLLQMNGDIVKWGAPELGSGAVITYRVVENTHETAGIRNCRAISGIVPLLQRSGLNRAAFDAALAGALSVWEKAANVRFEQAADETIADILIGAQETPKGIAYADVAVSPPAKPGVLGTITKGIVCLNPEQQWVLAGEEPKETTHDKKQEGGLSTLYVLAHEIGHVLGLDHPSPKGALMSFRYTGALQDLQEGDNAGIITLYGRSTSPAVPTATSLPH